MRLGTWPGKRFRDRAAPQGFPPKKKIQPGATAALRLAVDLTLAGRFCSRFSGDREKPGAKEGGGADLALLCPPGPVSRWIPPWAPKQKQSSLAPGFSWSLLNGEHFKPGAMRPSSEFPTPVRFAFPDTSERRSPGVGY